MLTEMLSGATVYIVTGYTDMRKGIDGLTQIVEGNLRKDVYNRLPRKLKLSFKIDDAANQI